MYYASDVAGAGSPFSTGRRRILYPIATMIIDIMGVIKQKNAYGNQTMQEIPSTPACATAQVFQGTITELTVAESWRVRLNISGA